MSSEGAEWVEASEGSAASAEARPPPHEHGVQSPGSPEEGASSTHRWAGQARESSLTTLPGQTDDAPLTSQTLGTWRTIGTLREGRQE